MRVGRVGHRQPASPRLAAGTSGVCTLPTTAGLRTWEVGTQSRHHPHLTHYLSTRCTPAGLPAAASAPPRHHLQVARAVQHHTYLSAPTSEAVPPRPTAEASTMVAMMRMRRGRVVVGQALPALPIFWPPYCARHGSALTRYERKVDVHVLGLGVKVPNAGRATRTHRLSCQHAACASTHTPACHSLTGCRPPPTPSFPPPTPSHRTLPCARPPPPCCQSWRG
jgi:hypothetical protein